MGGWLVLYIALKASQGLSGAFSPPTPVVASRPVLPPVEACLGGWQRGWGGRLEWVEPTCDLQERLAHHRLAQTGDECDRVYREWAGLPKVHWTARVQGRC